MDASRRASWFTDSSAVVLGLALLGCASEPAAEGRAPASSGPPVAEPPARDASTPAPSAANSGRPLPTRPARIGRDHLSAVACATDADCGWDDDCFPKRCVEASPREACDESGPPPGSCLCVGGTCTTKPSKPPVASGPCERHGCVVDRALGACVADTGGVPEGIRTNPRVQSGPSCDCVTPAQGCSFSWFDPIACESERDCWVEPSPRPHPMARPKHLRGRDFKPCTDGEIAPTCEQGQCALGSAYRC